MKMLNLIQICVLLYPVSVSSAQNFLQARAEDIFVTDDTHFGSESDGLAVTADGLNFIYVKRVFERDEYNQDEWIGSDVVLRSMKDGTIQKKIRVGHRLYAASFSPDQNSLAVCYQTNEARSSQRTRQFGIIRLQTQEMIQIGTPCGYEQFLNWEKDEFVTFNGRSNLNLETLLFTTEGIEPYIQSGLHGKRMSTHPKVVIESISRSSSDLVVRNKDGSFYKWLGIKVNYSNGRFFISRDQSRIVSLGASRVGWVRLQAREKPSNTFVASVGGIGWPDPGSGLNREIIDALKDIKRRGYTISAGVYNGRVNPLNEKVVGPGEKRIANAELVSISKSEIVFRVHDYEEINGIVGAGNVLWDFSINERSGAEVWSSLYGRSTIDNPWLMISGSKGSENLTSNNESAPYLFMAPLASDPVIRIPKKGGKWLASEEVDGIRQLAHVESVTNKYEGPSESCNSKPQLPCVKYYIRIDGLLRHFRLNEDQFRLQYEFYER